MSHDRPVPSDIPSGLGESLGAANRESESPSPAGDASSPKSIRIVPMTGWQSVMYALGRMLGKQWLFSKRSARDQEIVMQAYEEAHKIKEEERLRTLETDSVVELRHQTDEIGSAVVAFFGTKGAAATTTNATISSATLAEDGRVVVSLVDGNPAEGTAAARLGKNDGETVTIQTMAADLKAGVPIEHRRFKTEMAKARPSVNGVRVVSADSIMDETRRLSGEGMSNVLQLLGENSEFVLIDTANDIGDVPMRKVAEKADVFVFTANVGIPDSLRLLGTAMETMRRLGFADKVDHGVVVISNIPEGKSTDEYRKYLNKVNMEYEVVTNWEHKFDGVFMGIHYDSYIAQDKIVDLTKISRRTRQSYRQLVISILSQVGELRSLKVTGRGQLSSLPTRSAPQSESTTASNE